MLRLGPMSESRHSRPGRADSGQSLVRHAPKAIWRDKVRDSARIERLNVDPHAPRQFRVNGSLRNQDRFADAFGVKPDDAMYLAPERRVSLWQTERAVVCPHANR